MAIPTYVDIGNGISASALLKSVSWTHNISGNFLVLYANVANNTNSNYTLSATVGSTPMTVLTNYQYSSNLFYVKNCVLYLASPPTGSQTITLTVSATSAYFTANSVSYNGVVSIGSATTSSTSSTVYTGSTSNQLVCNNFTTWSSSAGTISSYSKTSRWSSSSATINVVAGDAAGGSSLTFSGTSPATAYNYGQSIFPLNGSNDISPAGATIAVTGTQPSLITQSVLSPAAATVTVTGTEPSLVTETVLTPAAASATVTGTAPKLDLIVTPPGGSLTGALITVTGSAPTLTMSLVTTGDTITITGGTPSTAGTAILTPASATVTVTGTAPTLLASMVPGSQTLPVTGGTPVLISVSVLSPAAAAATVTGGTPVVINPITLQPSAAAITITGSATTITVGVYYAPAPDPQHTAVLRHEERTHVMFGERIHSVRRASRLTEA